MLLRHFLMMENLEIVEPVSTISNTLERNKIGDPRKKRKRFVINKRLLPLKIHYFLLASATSAVLPFLPIFAKQLGISLAAIRVLQIVAPCLASLAKPLFGAIVDYLQSLKQILMLLLIIKSLCCLGIVFIPTPIGSGIQISSIFYCDFDDWLAPTPENLLHCTEYYNENATINCYAQCATCAVYRPNSSITDLLPEFLTSRNLQYNTTTVICSQRIRSQTMELSPLEEGTVLSITNETKPICSKNLIYNCSMTCPCLQTSTRNNERYTSVQFWMFLSLQLLLYVLTATMCTLTDTACHEMIPAESNAYGKQRMWYSIGWTSFSLLTIYLLDLFNTGRGYDYTIGFYITVSLMFLDFVVVCGIEVDPVRPMDSFREHLKFLMSCPRTVVFMVAVFYTGIIRSIIDSYLLGYLMDVNAPRKIMGSALTISCFSEIIGFYFSGKIIEKLGYFLTICLSLLGYSIRYFLYYLIQDSWFVLLSELSQGVTFSITFSSITAFSKSVAKVGTETTTQGLIGGLYTALGWAAGNVIGVLGNNRYGLRTTFQLAGIASIAGCFALLIVHALLIYFENRRKKTLELAPQENPAFESNDN